MHHTTKHPTRKQLHNLALAVLAVFALTFIFLTQTSFPLFALAKIYPTNSQHILGEYPLTINGTTFSVELAITPREWELGLSGRAMLSDKKGLLFFFDHSDRYGFWMPDMHFAIDIVWISRDWRIVDISPNIAPESYPTVFKPSTPAQYVLEVPAGSAWRYAWKAGDRVDWHP